MSVLKKISIFGYFILFGASLVTLLAVSAVAALMALPDVGILERCFTTAMYQVHLCPGSENYVKLKDISPYVLHAVIAAEDGSFYSHKGFDWHEMKQSLNDDLASGRFHRGGSTLTQQLAKNAFLNQEKSLWRKLKEAYLANAIENRYNKDFILEKYLNVVEFGESMYGIKPAALKYFNKSPSQLHPLEAAWLAMLLPNPKKYSQSYRKGTLTPFARKMVATILKRMQSFGKLSPANYQTAMANINLFPWSAISLATFEGGGPGYNLETDTAPTQSLDENALEDVLKEDEDRETEPVIIPSQPESAPAQETKPDDI